MSKKNKKKKLKALKNEVSTLRASLQDLMSFIGYQEGDEREPVKIIEMEPYEVFRQGLRETEEKYALKVS